MATKKATEDDLLGGEPGDDLLGGDEGKAKKAKKASGGKAAKPAAKAAKPAAKAAKADKPKADKPKAERKPAGPRGKRGEGKFFTPADVLEALQKRITKEVRKPTTTKEIAEKLEVPTWRARVAAAALVKSGKGSFEKTGSVLTYNP